MKLRIQPLFSVLLLFISPCCATRSLYEIVLTDLYNNFAIPIQSEKLLRKVQRLSDDYEAKILDNLQRLAVALMRDLLAFLQKDALSLEEILTKINTGGYQNPSGQERRKDTCCFYELSRWSFDEISRKLPKQPTDASEQNFRHLSVTTVEVFREAELLFNEYVQACAEIFGITDEIGRIVRNGIRSFYNLKKSEMLYNELHNDPWYLAAQASDGSWSTVLYSVMVPHTMQFSSKKMEDFINSVTTCFNKCVDGFDATCGDCLKEEMKARFRANCFEYLLRSVYVRYNTPSTERGNLVHANFEHALKTSDRSEPRPLK